MLDNTTAVAYIREIVGSKSKQCNKIVWDIWEFAKQRNLWLSSACPVIADKKPINLKENLNGNRVTLFSTKPCLC